MVSGIRVYAVGGRSLSVAIAVSSLALVPVGTNIVRENQQQLEHRKIVADYPSVLNAVHISSYKL